MAETDDSARQPPPSVLLVGAAGVGKFALIAALQPGVASKKAAPGEYALRLDTQ